LVRSTLGGLILMAAAVVGSVAWVKISASGHVYPADAVPPAPVALVLGAQVYDDGTPSPFLAARLALAKRLYDDGTVRAILVSGDNGRPDYDEPGAMRRWLVAQGVPEHRVAVDYAGFDTYDSCLRANRIFGVDRVIVVTQAFHVPRAVALCRAVGVVADGVGDDSVAVYRRLWWRGIAREQLASVKAAWDVLTRRDPVFLGPRETGVEDALRE
jgi:vancomycin permeability regulator SanA